MKLILLIALLIAAVAVSHIYLVGAVLTIVVIVGLFILVIIMAKTGG